MTTFDTHIMTVGLLKVFEMSAFLPCPVKTIMHLIVLECKFTSPNGVVVIISSDFET